MATTPIVINHLSDLQAIQNNLSGYYVLGANIDASGFVFLPIGSAANPFAGFFDGQGHTISNLTINNVSNTDSGLFGDIGATGTVSNVGLINESVTSSYSYVGGLVGENFGTVSQSYVTGNVSGATYVGALVGFNGASGSIIQSFATGAASGQVAGGLVGLNGGAISDSYATGAVNNISQDAPDSRITNFYHTLDPIYELTPPLSLFAEFVRSSGSFVQQQFFKGQLQDFLVKSPYGFSSSEAGIVANDLLNNMIVKAHEGTNIEIPFGQPAAHVINNFGTNVDFDAHDQTAYFHDVEAHLTGLSPNSSDFLLHV